MIQLGTFAKKFLDVGVNVLPTKIKDKYPHVPTWKQFQERMITEEELKSIYKKESGLDGIGVVTGKVSGNLEVLDFDNKLGNVEEIFDKFKDDDEVYGIVNRCVIESTQSGGFHIFYRCETIEGNRKLASLKKPDGKFETVIETRGEGGYCVCYPSKNYKLLFGSWENLPTITEDERELLFQHAMQFNEEIKRVEYSDESLSKNKYEEKPGDAFTESIEGLAEAKRLLIENGWNLIADKGAVEHWNRPGAKTKRLDATFRDKVFYVFSSNAQPFEPNHSYTPFSILILLKFNGDVKEAVKYLINSGYGKRKQPDEAVDKSGEITSQFWRLKFTKRDGTPFLDINLVNFIEFLKQHGFYKMYIGNDFIFIKMTDNIIKEITIPMIKDYVLSYIEALPRELIGTFSNIDLRNKILTDSRSLYAPNFLENLEPINIEIMRDNKDESFFFFRNCWVRSNESGVTALPYSKMTGFVWANQRIDRDYIDPMTVDDTISEFESFIRNICNDEDDRIEALETSIGYLLHTYKDPRTAKAIIFCDQGSDKTTSSDESNGRSGKSLVGKAIGKLRNEVRIDARNFSIEKSFAFQQVGFDTQFINFNDVDKRFNFEKLYSIITDAITVEKKNRDEFSIPFEKAPKILISTNYTVQVDGSSGEDRKFEIEFSDHYSIDHKPQDEFGHRFFDDWTELEWNKFYSYMIGLAAKYIREGLKSYLKKNLSRRLLLQETSIDFLDYMEDNSDTRKFYTGPHYDSFIQKYPNYKKLTPNTFGKWIKKYAMHNKIKWKPGRDNEGRYYEFYLSQETEPPLEGLGI